MLKESDQSNHLKPKPPTSLDSNQSSFFDLLEGEKAIRYLQSKHSIEEMKLKVLKQRIEQRKKKLDVLKGEIKKLRNGCEKNKDTIGVLIKERDFLTEMINFSVISVNK